MSSPTPDAERNEWADLWYFVMDEAPTEFERIVTTCAREKEKKE